MIRKFTNFQEPFSDKQSLWRYVHIVSDSIEDNKRKIDIEIWPNEEKYGDVLFNKTFYFDNNNKEADELLLSLEEFSGYEIVI